MCNIIILIIIILQLISYYIGNQAAWNDKNIVMSPVSELIDASCIHTRSIKATMNNDQQMVKNTADVLGEEFIEKSSESSIVIYTDPPRKLERIFLNIPKMLKMKDLDHRSTALITDIFAVPQNGSMLIYAVFSALNLRPANAGVEYNDFVLTHGTTTVKDMTSVKNHVEALRDLKFILPYIVNSTFFYVDIRDNGRQFTYKHVYVQVLPTERIGGIGVCAMVSDFNTVGEVKNWVAWYKLQQITNVMLYSIKPVPEVERVIQPAIDSGFVRYYQYHYPLNKYRRFEQRSIQLAVINSCYFRHRHLYDGIVLIDVDEFIHSPLNPYNLTETFTSVLRSEWGDYFRFFSTMYYLKESDTRTKSFDEGTIFSDYVLKEPSRFSGRSKYLMRTSSEGSLSTHYCVSCTSAPPIEEDKIVIHHFKLNHKNKTQLIFDDSMKIFTPPMKKTLHSLLNQ